MAVVEASRPAFSVTLAALAVLAFGCSDRTLVANTTAAYVYAEQQYEWDCVEVKGPETCGATRAELIEAKRQTELANKVYQIGKLPKAEKKKLAGIKKRLAG